MLRPSACLGLVVVLSACGGAATTPIAPTVAYSSGTVITGGEKLGWDQSAADDAAVSALGFAVYVDGSTRVVLSDTTCTAGSDAFACTAPLPVLTKGIHTVELSSFLKAEPSVESERSPSLTVTVAGVAAPTDGVDPGPQRTPGAKDTRERSRDKGGQ